MPVRSLSAEQPAPIDPFALASAVAPTFRDPLDFGAFTQQESLYTDYARFQDPTYRELARRASPDIVPVDVTPDQRHLFMAREMIKTQESLSTALQNRILEG